MEIIMENLDKIVDDMTGSSKKNVGGGYRKMRKASLKEKGKKPARTCDISSSEEEISKEKKTSRKIKKNAKMLNRVNCLQMMRISLI